MFGTNRAAAKVAIMRAGELCTISEPTLGATNGYGKPDPNAETWSSVGQEYVCRIYQPGAEPEQARLTGGRYRREAPILLLAHDTAAQEGFRVQFGPTTYEVDSMMPLPTHYEATTTVVQ